jgi:hypothetical protein
MNMKLHPENARPLLVFVAGLLIGVLLGACMNGPIVQVAVGGRGGDSIVNYYDRPQSRVGHGSAGDINWRVLRHDTGGAGK